MGFETTEAIFIRIKKELFHRLERQVRRMNTNKTDMVKQALVRYLEELEANDPILVSERENGKAA